MHTAQNARLTSTQNSCNNETDNANNETEQENC